jgi:hypothetical protein
MSNFRYDTEWHDNDKDDIHDSIMAWDYDVKIEYVKEDGSTGFGYTYWEEYTRVATDSDGSTYLEETAEFSLEDENGHHIDTYDIDRWRVVYDEGDDND